MRLQPSPAADNLWRALRRAKDKGLSVSDVESRKICSAPYARKRLRLWSQAGHLRVAEGQPGVFPHQYFMMPSAPTEPPLVTTTGDVIPKQPAMTANEFAAIRRTLGLNKADFGTALGWTGHPNTASRAVRRFESGERLVDDALAAKVRALPAAVPGVEA